MKIKKCDICKKQIKDDELSLYLRTDGFKFESFEFCLKCSQPIIKFLKNKKIIKSTNEKRK